MPWAGIIVAVSECVRVCVFICACVRVLKRRNSGCGREKEKGGLACENVYIWACVCVCIMLAVWRDCMKD